MTAEWKRFWYARKKQNVIVCWNKITSSCIAIRCLKVGLAYLIVYLLYYDIYNSLT